MIHCALVTVDDGGRRSVDSRVIDVDPTDRFDRAGRVNSGIDLMLDRARSNGTAVGSIGVACRTTAQGREIASRGAGPRRQIHLVGDAESVARALAESGEIAAHPDVVVVDCGDTGVTMFRLDTSSGAISDITRSTAVSGFALDAALADQVAAQTSPMTSRAGWAALVSGCRTAKEDLSQEDSTTFQVAGVDREMSVSMLEAAIATMAERLITEVTGFVDSASVPVVLVGGLANIPALHAVVERDGPTQVIRPESPELLCAIGAALLAGSGGAAPLRLAFIGGRRHRDWLSAVPLAVVGALLAGTMLTVYAVGAALTGNSSPEVLTPSGPASSVVGEPAVNVATATSATSISPTRSVAPAVPESSTTIAPETTTEQAPVETFTPASPRVPNRPGWATTELPTMPSSQVPTSTITPENSAPGPSTPAVPGSQTGSPNPYSGSVPPPKDAPTRTLTPYPNPLDRAPSRSAPGTPTTAPVG
ncbi:hypothetical protein [Williamsia phyllosphaerae]|uniref:Chaperone protein HscA n=1 Tax=Williamsia phyllosphaerae TaxID=885042 RepID=A0ABQ1UZR3_9NOCA|nr:hypothetical protein [Williamsia phyllosphaerae]GGF31971.1 hypothetical protein GCM10007298_29780 [Williamsia phyllosphaerae]